MSAPREILELVERFDRNVDAYRSGEYNETQLRREFLDPFFTALGWDVDNKQGFAEAYKDVVHEDAIKIGTATKAPDYSFRIGGLRKFFVEAKKPSVNVREDVSPAFQLRRYAWSAKLPLSILTDFEEFAIYDCRLKPQRADKPSTARTIYLRYTEYDKQWEEIASIFSKEAVLKGSFDKYAEKNKIKKGTAEVDDAFLREIEQWRKSLASNVAIRNPKLTQRELNFAVQRTIDRIIFLRICEDRGVENYGSLMSLQNGERVYRRLAELFHRADEKYNSGLFHFRKEKDRFEPADELTLELSIDDKPLKEIVKNLYYPESPYEFSVLSADILGQVYEQFLGKVIRLTEGHHAVIEDKPEVKKAGGVYYTPTYIVDYIVKNTVGKLLEGLTPKQASKLRILDPACGSGSFLIGAYQYLLDCHRDWYVKDGVQKWALGKHPALYQAQGGEWRLTTGERKRILLNNIYGVDIDTQAVEVTKLSLLLKVLEGENEQTLARQFKMFHERALPDLGSNIKCGNSLIGHDFYDGEQLSFGDDQERMRINAFDWKKEFKEIMDAGGFDAVIGNPPYVLVGSEKPLEREYFMSGKFQLTKYKVNTYLLFVERGLTVLKLRGRLGYIIPKSLVFNTYFAEARRVLLDRYAIPQVVEIREKVFEKAEVGDSILFFAMLVQHPHRNELKYHVVRNIVPTFEILSERSASQGELLKGENAGFFKSALRLKADSTPLGQLCLISNGLNPGNVRDILFSESKDTRHHQKLVLGRDIQRFSLSWSGTWVNYDPALKNTIKISQTKSKKGMTAQKKVDFALRDPRIYLPSKVLVRKTADRIIASFDDYGYYFDSLSYGIQLKDRASLSLLYILGVINSTVLNFLHDSLSMNKDKVFAKVLAENLSKLPIRTINFSISAEKSHHDKIVALVEQMLGLNKQLAAAKTEHEKTTLQRQIDATDKQIDALVYELYELTEEEIKIVEGGV